jgi:hypothetical protein
VLRVRPDNSRLVDRHNQTGPGTRREASRGHVLTSSEKEEFVHIVKTTTVVERGADIQLLVARVRSEYEEMPGLRLTAPQAQRLWCLDRHICESVLSQLVEDKFLKRSTAGHYLRARR